MERKEENIAYPDPAHFSTRELRTWFIEASRQFISRIPYADLKELVQLKKYVNSIRAEIIKREGLIRPE